MNLRKLTRNPGWSRLFRVFVWLWYGLYVLLILLSQLMGVNWGKTDWPHLLIILILYVLTPWVILSVMRLVRFVLEGFFPKEG